MNRGQHIRRRLGGLLMLFTVLSITVVLAGPTTFKSEDFNAYRLDRTVWNFLDLKQNCILNLTGVNSGHAYLNLTAPAGESHDVWTDGISAPAIMQACANENFTAEAKFTSGIGGQTSQYYQGQGILVYADNNNFIRFDFVLGGGDSTNLFAAAFIGGTSNPAIKINKGVAAKFAAPMTMRINRTGNVWTVMSSKNGTTYDTAGTFTQAITVLKIGLYVINAGTPPTPFTLTCDYFQNLDAPIANDSLTNVPPSTAAPLIYSVRFITAPDAIDVLWRTDELANGTLEYGATTSYGGPASPAYQTTFTLDHRLSAIGLSASSLYHFRLSGTDQASRSANSGDLTMTSGSYVDDTTSVSDDFNTASIDGSLWSTVNPLGDATFSIVSKQLSIAVPGGVAHEVYTTGNTAPRVVQNMNPSTNVHTWILKFNSIPAGVSGGSSSYPIQGLYLEQDENNVMRCDIWSDGTGVLLYVAAFVDGFANRKDFVNVTIPYNTAPLWLKVTQGGATWTVSYSANGSTWNQAWGGYNVMRVTKAGPYAGNTGTSPQPFTALIDYFQAATPAKPVLRIPAPGATNVLRPVAFAWDTATGAANYRMQVSTVSNFASTVFDSTFSATSRYVSGLNASSSYYWRVRGVGTRVGLYSAAQSFTTGVATPAAPTLVSPPDDATGVAITPTLTWRKPATATGYRLQVANDTAFTSLAYTDSTLTDTVATTSALAYNTKYFWRVSARNAGGYSNFSVIRRFTTRLETPPAPTLASPAKGATDQPVSLTLSWNTSTGAASYWLELGTDSLFGSPLVSDTAVNSTSRAVSGLAHSTVYYWRVRAKNAGGVSTSSEIWNFTTVIAPPAQPTLLAPANGAPDQLNSVTFSWTRPAGTVTFRLVIATDSTFANGVVFNDSTIENETASVTTLSYGQKYFWRVSGKNAGGTGPYSVPFSFFTMTSDPTVPRQLQPANGSTTTDRTVILRWTAPAGASSFHLQVATKSDFTSGIVVDDAAVLDTTRTLTNLTYMTTYYWRVNSDNVGGISPWSPTFSFTVVVPTPSQVVLIVPAEGALTSRDSTRTLWSSSSPLVDRYQIDYAADASFRFQITDSTVTDTTKMLKVGLIDGQLYHWRVRAHNAGGWGPYSTVQTFTASSTVGIDKPRELPVTVSLSQNYPNPFNPSTQIEFGLPAESHVTLAVYNVIGERVATLVDDNMSVGWHTVRFDASRLSSGLYIYRLAAGATTIVHKMMLVK